MRKNIILSCIISAVIFFAIGCLIGTTVITNKSAIENSVIKQTKEKIMDRLIEGKVVPAEPEKMPFVSGTVTEIGQDYLILSPSAKTDPFETIFPYSGVKILVNESTKIEEWELKSPENYQKELIAYENSTTTNKEVPFLYQKTASQLQKIKIGYYVISAKSSNSDLKGLTSFISTELSFSPNRPY